MEVGWPMPLIFLMYISMLVFATLNVVTGVFCQSAIESAQHDKDLASAELLANRELLQKKLAALFNDIDEDASGMITMDELECCLQQRSSQAWFESLGIESCDAWTLVKLLDVDGTGEIDIEEFTTGVMGLRGSAKAVH